MFPTHLYLVEVKGYCRAVVAAGSNESAVLAVLARWATDCAPGAAVNGRAVQLGPYERHERLHEGPFLSGPDGCLVFALEKE